MVKVLRSATCPVRKVPCPRDEKSSINCWLGEKLFAFTVKELVSLFLIIYLLEKLSSKSLDDEQHSHNKLNSLMDS